MKDMGSCPCPRCLTPKNLFSQLGLVQDMKIRITNLHLYAIAKVVKAREYIYQRGNTVDGPKVEDALGEGSWVPTLVSTTDPFQFMTGQTSYLQNQFFRKLGPFGLNPFRMLVVDFMHECELGTWKALFIHLIRLLYALTGGTQLVATLDRRYADFVHSSITY